METELVKEQETVSQLELSLQAEASESQALKRVQSLQVSCPFKPCWSVNFSYKDESVLICNVNLQDLQKSQSLLASAQAELHHIKEKNVDLKRCNVLLEQETLKAESKLHSLVSKCEQQQQNIRELEVELADNLTKPSSLQEELQSERAKLAAANKKVFELQQQLSRVELQLHEQEVLIQKINNLERNNRDLSDTLSVLREKHHEEKTTRTLLEKRVEELQQQVTTLKVKEATLTQNNAEVNQLFQELNARQTDVEAESRRTKEEVKTSQELNHKLKEDLLHSRREYNRIHSKYMEKQIQAKTMLHQTKQKFFKETAQRNSVIQKLEKEAKRLICTLAEERDKFLEERRELLQKITKLEEEGARTTSAVQHRVNMLEEEKRLLHHQIQMLSRQNCSLESALRKSGSTLENTKTNNGSIEGLLSASLRLPSYVDNLDKCHVKVIEHAVMNSTQLSVSTLQRSEQGYLNLTMPSVPPEPGDK
uniref:Coiled-coil domain containing 30 n=1 Tax=Takifugu rubripes TaxID=31033 RepID=A0A674P0R5_TAKRU